MTTQEKVNARDTIGEVLGAALAGAADQIEPQAMHYAWFHGLPSGEREEHVRQALSVALAFIDEMENELPHGTVTWLGHVEGAQPGAEGRLGMSAEAWFGKWRALLREELDDLA